MPSRGFGTGWRPGGLLVALGEASRWLTREKVSLLPTTTELRDGRPETEPSEEKEGAEKPKAMDKDAKPEPFDLEKAIQPERERPDAVPGALLRVVLDPEHWLAAGTDGEVHAIVESRRVFTPLQLDEGTNVGVYPKKDEVVGSGLVWDDARDRVQRRLPAGDLQLQTGLGLSSGRRRHGPSGQAQDRNDLSEQIVVSCDVHRGFGEGVAAS